VILSWASVAEADRMGRVHAQAFDKPWPAADFAALLATPAAFGFVVADADNIAPLGLILCRVAAGEMEVLTVGVAPEARGLGLGRELMAAALAAGRNAGASEVFLEVGADNAAAIGLYASLGFRRSGLRKAYYDRGEAGTVDALVMRLDLAPAGP
jgi:ribosomal-protein-alanine N-acetyltransferase